jgi:hypothetical protein
MLIGCRKQVAETSAATQGAAPVDQTVQSPPHPRQQIITKDGDYMLLINPPTGDKLLKFSASFTQKEQDIEARVASLSDHDLRQQARDEAWRGVSLYPYEQEAKAAIASIGTACLQRHRMDWFEVGHVGFSSDGHLAVYPVEASPLHLIGDFAVPIDISTVDAVFSRFHELVGGQVKQSVLDREEQLRQHPEWVGTVSGISYDELVSMRDDNLRQLEKQMRVERIVLVGQGDLIDHRIDKLMVVDYPTETILLALDPVPLTQLNADWKFDSRKAIAKEQKSDREAGQ